MKKVGLAVLAFAGLFTGLGFSQQPQSAQPQNSKQHVADLNLGDAPTPVDMYCSGFITTDKVPDKLFVAAGHNSPDQSRYGGLSDTIFIHGHDLKEGDRYQIIRRVRDSNHYELYPGEASAIHNAGQAYFELGIVKVVDVQKSTGVAKFEMSCADVMPGDLAIPLAERQAPPFRKVSLDRYAPPNGKPVGRIIMGEDFDDYLGSKYKAYINIGANKGLKPGDYLRATRTYSYTYYDFEAGLSLKASVYEDTQDHPQHLPMGDVSSLPRRTLGDMIVLQVHPKSSTVMVLTALEDIHVGDGVEVMDITDAPVLPPIQPSFSNAPEPEANTSTNVTPPRINCSATPTSVRAGESANITCDAVSPDNRPINITYVANGGKISSNRNQATLDTADTAPGPISVRATAFDDRQLSASTVLTVNVESPAPAVPTAQKLMELEFKPNSGYVDNRSKAILDDVALKMQQDPSVNAVLTGSTDTGEPARLGLQRADNSMTYLTKSKGIDASRIQTKAGSEPGRKVEVWTLPAGAALPGAAPAQPPQGAAQQPDGDSQQPVAVPPTTSPEPTPAATPQATPPQF
jgi:outer membrane protein OmpA-like peptidoglycan-associated protein